MNKEQDFLNTSQDEENSSDEQLYRPDGDEPVSAREEVGKSGEALSHKPIEERFNALIFRNCERPFDWYKAKNIELDKSDASKIRRGLVIPPRWLRIAIAQHFNTDSANIWTIDDLPHIKALIKKQEKKE